MPGRTLFGDIAFSERLPRRVRGINVLREDAARRDIAELTDNKRKASSPRVAMRMPQRQNSPMPLGYKKRITLAKVWDK